MRAAEALGRGRLGVAIRDVATGREWGWRAGERFPLTSTFKLVLAAAILARVDRGELRLAQPLAVTAADMVPHAPVTGPRVGGAPMSLDELCAAILVWSDNPAANLLLPLVGGPPGLTAFARGLGDSAFRLDRPETALNEATPGDPRDTTTPAAMRGTLGRLLLGDALSPASRGQMAGWLEGSRTGDARLRAGLPAGWRCGEKTGGGGHGTANDIGILWPPGREPLLVAAYLTEAAAAPPAARDAALAAVGRAAAALVAQAGTGAGFAP
jgi:beta-lactamase class A